MRVVFVNRFFHPDHSATSQMLTDLAAALSSRGFDVGVITSRQLYEDSAARLAARENAGGVAVQRIWTTRFGRGVVALRAIDYLTFYLSAYRAIRRERGAVVVAMTDPPLLSIVAVAAAPRVVNWVQDLFPEVAVALGMRVPGFVRRLRDWSFRKARVNVAIGDLMAGHVAGRTVVQHNWASPGLRPIPRDPSEPFTVAYSGNLGRAHEFQTMLGAMDALPGVRFAMTGSGTQMAALRANAPANVAFRAYVPRERLAESLSAADVHLVSLQPSLEGLIVPSKIYGILAVGRPVIHIGSAEGEIGRLVTDNRCGLVVPSGDAAGLTAAIGRLAAEPVLRAEMGSNGLDLYKRRFAPAIAFDAWTGILHHAND